MVELCGFPNSICARKVRMPLLEKGLECENTISICSSARSISGNSPDLPSDRNQRSHYMLCFVAQ